MKLRIFNLVLLFITIIYSINAQHLTLEDIFLKNAFKENHPENFKFLKDDNFYTVIEKGAIIKKETISGKAVDTLLKNIDTLQKSNFKLFTYDFSPKEKYILLEGNRKGIYRRSYDADYYLYEISTQKLISLKSDNTISYATFSPDESKVAYLDNNNLWWYDINSGDHHQITKDGIRNKIINGSTDWVYEEEFAFNKAFFWSPDSKFLAFYQFDESKVKEYNMQKWEGLYPEDYRYKYPKAGEENSKIFIKVLDVSSKEINTLKLDSNSAYYIPRVEWDDNSHLIIRALNRKQSFLTILSYNPQIRKIDKLYEEENKSIEVESPLFFNRGQIITTSEVNNSDKKIIGICRNGKSTCNKVIKTKGYLYQVKAYSSKQDWLYYSCTFNGWDKAIARTKVGTNKVELIAEEGHNTVHVSENGNYFILIQSQSGVPPQHILYDAHSLLKVRVLEDNKGLKEKLKNLNLAKSTFFTFKTSEDVKLNGWVMKPTGFDSTKTYPLIMYTYGGPGSQSVLNSWSNSFYLWHQYLTSKGFIVACVDGRGTGGRGTAFRTSTYGELGKLETKDQIEAAKYFGSLPYIKKDKIGIWGWSFGGYLSTMSILLGNDIFKSAIAVAPVSSWRFYDTIYSERYLSTPQDNPNGYDDNSPISNAKKLKGDYLLIHGTSDDNVHIQNTFALQEALIKEGKQFQTFIYPNKSHGISGTQTRYHLFTLLTNFWEKALK